MDLDKELNDIRNRLYLESKREYKDDGEVIMHLDQEYLKDWSKAREEIKDLILDSLGS